MNTFKLSTLICILFSFLHCYGIGEDLNSVVGVKIGMTTEQVIQHLKEINKEYEDFLYAQEIDFKYDLLQDAKEMNLVKLYFSDSTLIKIEVYFYKYQIHDQIQTNNRFQKYLDQLDEMYDNDINWKGKWKSTDGKISVKTETSVIQGDVFDVLVIRDNTKKIK